MNRVPEVGLVGRTPCVRIPPDLGLNKCQAASSCQIRDCSAYAAEKQAPVGLAHVKASYAYFLVLGNMMQGHVYIPFVSLSLELQLISLL